LTFLSKIQLQNFTYNASKLQSRFFNVIAARAAAVLCCVVCLSAATLTRTPQALNRAEDLYWHTRYEASLALLDKNAADAPTNFLIGRNYLMSGDFKKATDYLQKAVGADSGNSNYVDWLGRAYGKRAETSNPLMAPMLASKARQAFERSVALDPKNVEALSDLFEYYLEAPGFLGGGYDKALTVANKISAVNPAEGYFAKAQLAKKHREFDDAEQHLRHAAALAPHQVGRLIDLARFLADQGRTRESDEVFAQAQKLDPNAPKVWFARARTLVKQKRNVEEARNLLQKYMRASITADDPPKNDAIDLLKEMGGA
jgi:tetratricopeptide (TPR) repeat protein